MVQAVIKNLKDQLVPFISVFSQKCFQVFHGRRLDRLISVEFEDRTDGIKNKIPSVDGFRRKVPRALG